MREIEDAKIQELIKKEKENAERILSNFFNIISITFIISIIFLLFVLFFRFYF